MAVSFKNPANGYTESIDLLSVIGMFLFGGIFLAYRGLWGHFVIWMIVAGSAFAALGPPGTMFVLVLSFFYACCITSILKGHYLRKGWVEA